MSSPGRPRPSRPRVVLLTSAERRHRYAAGRLAQELDLVGLVEEPKKSGSGATPPAVVREHFAERDAVEEALLGQPEFPAVDRRQVDAGAVNDAATFDWVRAHDPDYVLLYGTSIIRPPLLEFYDGRMVNIHLGLSPYYRGAGTNFWALVRRQPECVGATIHLAVQKVDAGPMITQVRPTIDASDGPHEIGTKTLIAGIEALSRAVHRLAAGRADLVPQDTTRGEVFRKKDFTPDAVVEMRRQFATAMIPEFLHDRENRLSRYPIHTTD